MSLNERATLVCAYQCEKCGEVVAEYRLEQTANKLPNCVTCYTDMKLLRKVNKLTGEKKMLSSWDEYKWESWIPVEVQKQIEKFWSPNMHRSPRHWKEDETEQGALLPCQRSVEIKRLLDVHAWNNIGRIVHEDGTFDYVAFYQFFPSR
jgi:hypothetical protein